MRAVLYADDMEPITVIELSELAERYLNKYGTVHLSILAPLTLSDIIDYGQRPLPPPWSGTVRIFAESFVRRGRKHMMLFTPDEESALLLKCAFLPGQQSRLQEREREAFARGFLKALAAVGSGPER